MRRLNIGYLLAIILWTATQISSSSAAKDEIVFGFGASYCPFKCDRETTGMDGFEVDILREIFQTANLKLVINRIPETRVLLHLDNGSIDVATQLQWTIDQTDSLVVAEEPTSLLVVGALHRAEMNFNFDGIESLKSVVFVGNLGTEWPAAMQAYVDPGAKTAKVMLISDDNYFPRVFELLRIRRADITIDDMSVLNFELRKAKIEDQFRLERADLFEPVPSYAIFSKNHPRAREFEELVRRAYENYENQAG